MNDLHFGISVGIDRYPGFPGRDLGSARRDAAAFYGWLTDPTGGGLPADNARLITVDDGVGFRSAADGRPTIGEVNVAMRDLNSRIREQLSTGRADWSRTRIYLYVAGHGIGPGHGESALLMADSDVHTLNNCMELSRYAGWYLRCALVHEVIVFADCCRELTQAPDEPIGVPFTTCQLAPSGTKVLLAYASRLGTQAWEPASADERDRARGYFTVALLDGLRGRAPGDPRTGLITAATLAGYVYGEVERLTSGNVPYPQRGEWPADLVVANSIFFGPAAGAQPGPHFTATIHPPAGQRNALVLLDEDEAVHARWQPGDPVPWVVGLEEGLYEVRSDTAEATETALAGEGLFRLRGGDRDVRL